MQNAMNHSFELKFQNNEFNEIPNILTFVEL